MSRQTVLAGLLVAALLVGCSGGGPVGGGSASGGGSAGGGSASVGGGAAGGGAAGGGAAGGGGASGGGSGNPDGGAGGGTAAGGGGAAGGGSVPRPPGDTCADATPAGVGTVTGSLAGYTNDYGAGQGCTGTAGAERVYAVTVPAGKRLVATLTPTQTTYNPSLNVVASPASACDSSARVCLASSDAPGNGTPETVTFTNVTSAEVTVFLMVETGTASSVLSGTYSLAVALETPPVGDRCEAPLALSAGSTVPGDLASSRNDYVGSGASASCPSGVGPDAVYSLTVPPGARATVTLTPSSGLNTSLAVVADAAQCTARECAAATNSGVAAGQPDVVVLGNAAASPLVVLLVVDASAATPTTTTFTLSVVFDTPGPGDRCEGASTLVPNGPPSSAQSTADAGNDFGPGANCGSATAGPDRAYALEVPAGQRATVVVTPSGGFNPSLAVVAGPASRCTELPRACLTSVDVGGSGAADTLLVNNPGGTAKPVFVVVDSLGTTGGGYELAATAGAIPPGDVCENAGQAITQSTVLRHQSTQGLANDYGLGANCNASGGPDRAYEVVVPPGQRVTAVLTPTTDGGLPAWDPTLSVVKGPAAACAASPRVCVSSSDRLGDGLVETASAINSGAAMQSYFVVADSFGPSELGTFDLALTIASVPQGDVCESAVPVQHGTVLMNQTNVGFGNDYSQPSTSCFNAYSTGPEKVYAITIPAGQLLTVKVTVDPTGTSDTSIYVVKAPASNCTSTPVCLAGTDLGFGGDDETLTYRNATSSPLEVFVMVDTFSQTSPATYNVAFTLGP